MKRTARTAALLVLVPFGACGSNSTGVAPGSSGLSGDKGTPESMIDDPAIAGEASGGNTGSAAAAAEAAGTAFVQASFDAKAAKVVKAVCTGKKLKLTLDGVLFDFDHDNLQPDGDDILAQVKKVAVDPYPAAHITVEGHTDSVGTDAHNDDLSLRRARTVAAWMQAHGVDGSRLDSKGYGKRFPRVPNTSDENRAKNRRVEFVVIDPKAGASCAGGGGGGGGHGDGGGGGDGRVPPPNPGMGNLSPGQGVYPAFSYRYDDANQHNVNNWHDHLCVTFDPKWVRPDGPPQAYDKKAYGATEGTFLDQCPTDNVVASCDLRTVTPSMEWTYAGASEALIALRQQACTNLKAKWTRVGTAAPVAKAAGGSFVLVCDHHDTEKRCIEATKAANENIVFAYKQACGPAAQPPRCPAQGAFGVCEAQGVLTYYYGTAKDAEAAAATFRMVCESQAGKWSVP